LQGIDIANDALLFACEGLVDAAAAAAAAEGSTDEMVAGLSPTALDPNFAQAFNLSSRPTSFRKIW
jgi:hypothetical protein